MEILNLGGTEESPSTPSKSRKPLRVLLGIGALAAVTGIGSTLAANISLNGGNDVEFGQGVVTTAACDSTITVTPISEFDNSVDPAVFNLDSIDLSDIDNDPGDCDGKTLTIKGYGDSDPTVLFTKTYVVANTSTSIDMSLEDPRILASDLYKITIESTETPLD